MPEPEDPREDNAVDPDEIFKWISRMTKKYDMVDDGFTMFNVWISLTRMLTEIGCTPEELMRDVGWHSAHQSSKGGVQ